MKLRSFLLATFSGMAILAGCNSEGTEEVKPAAGPPPAPAPDTTKGPTGTAPTPPMSDMEKPRSL